MNNLDRIISRNARVAMKRADDHARERDSERVVQAVVARRMVRRLDPNIDENDDPEEFKRRSKNMGRTIRLLMAGQQRWNSEYIEAFAESVGTVPERLVAVDYDAAKVPDASRAEYLSRALGRRLKPAEVSKIVENINREMDRPGMFQLISRIADVLLDASDKHEAATTVSHLIVQSAAFRSKSAKSHRSAKRK